MFSIARSVSFRGVRRAPAPFFRQIHGSRPVFNATVSPTEPLSPVVPSETLGRLKGSLKDALKAKDSSTATVIRSVLSDIDAQAKRKEQPKEHGQSQEVKVIAQLKKSIKVREDAAKSFRKVQHEERALAEEKEVTILKTFMPKDVA